MNNQQLKDSLGEEEKTDGMLAVHKIVYMTNHILLIRHCESHLSFSHYEFLSTEETEFTQSSKHLVYGRPGIITLLW